MHTGTTKRRTTLGSLVPSRFRYPSSLADRPRPRIQRETPHRMQENLVVASGPGGSGGGSRYFFMWSRRRKYRRGCACVTVSVHGGAVGGGIVRYSSCSRHFFIKHQIIKSLFIRKLLLATPQHRALHVPKQQWSLQR